MIVIQSHEMHFGVKTNFRAEEIAIKFAEKYQGWKINIKGSLPDTKVSYENILENPIDLRNLVKDFGSICVLTVTLTDKNCSSQSFYLQQLPGLCGVSVINRYANLENEFLDLTLELLYYMGYTVAMISVFSEHKLIPELVKKGFKPYMSLKNRRTHNNVTLFYKRLINT